MLLPGIASISCLSCVSNPVLSVVSLASVVSVFSAQVSVSVFISDVEMVGFWTLADFSNTLFLLNGCFIEFDASVSKRVLRYVQRFPTQSLCPIHEQHNRQVHSYVLDNRLHFIYPYEHILSSRSSVSKINGVHSASNNLSETRAHHSGRGIISMSFSVRYKIIPDASVTFACTFNEFISSESLTNMRQVLAI